MTDSSSIVPRTEKAPTLARRVTLNFRGDWGQANMHRICGWLAQEVGDRSPDGSQFAIWSGRGGTDSIEALSRGAADVVIVTPTAAARLFYSGAAENFRAYPDLRCLGVIGQDDRLVVAVDSALGVSEISDLAEVAGQLRISTSPDDGVNLVGFTAHALLRFSGVDVAEVERRGGSMIYNERPPETIESFRSGAANVLIFEAVMLPSWQRINELTAVSYLPISGSAAAAFAEWSWPTGTLEPDYLPGLSENFTTLDFSDFALLCRADLPDDVAELIAWCMVTTRGALEAQYRHIPFGRSPVSYPITFDKLTSAPLPLHPAAERIYNQLGDVRESPNPLWGAGMTAEGKR